MRKHEACLLERFNDKCVKFGSETKDEGRVMSDEWERMREAMWLVQVSGSPKATSLLWA